MEYAMKELGVKDEMELFSDMLVEDIEEIPASVIAAFGYLFLFDFIFFFNSQYLFRSNTISKLKPEVKETLMEKIGMIERDDHVIPYQVSNDIVSDGVQSMVRNRMKTNAKIVYYFI